MTQENSICLVLIDEMIKFLEKTIVETNVIFNVVDHIELVLKSMAEFAMLDPKNLDFNIEEIDINDCISNIFKIYSEGMKEKNLEKIIFLDKEIKSKKWKTDKKKLETILMVTITNAIKYSDENKVIEINVNQKSEDLIKISIKNEGIGLNDKQLLQLNSLFEDYYSNEIPENSVGIGLSLRIASALLKYLGKKKYNKFEIITEDKFVEISFYIRNIENDISFQTNIIPEMANAENYSTSKNISKINDSILDNFSNKLKKNKNKLSNFN